MKPNNGSAVEQQFVRSVDDAEMLLAFVAENGKLATKRTNGAEPGRQIVESILKARDALNSGEVSAQVRRDFWLAFADLSHLTQPVTAGSLALSRCSKIRVFKCLVLLLSLAVILASIWLFVNNSIAAEVTGLIDEQNGAALKLWSDLQFYKQQGSAGSESAEGGMAQPNNDGAALERRAYTGATQPAAAGVARLTPDELFAETVEFSRRSNWLLETASRLNYYFNILFAVDPEPVVFDWRNVDGVTHLRIPPDISTTQAIVGEGLNQIVAYQLIRNFAQAVYKSNTVLYSGLTNYLLPAVYALLGASLQGLRLYARLMRRKAYLPSSAHSARYFIALIAGIVIGAFGSLIPKGMDLPPLAIAFIVGYGVEAFFSRLDDLIARFKKSAPGRAGQLTGSMAEAGAD